MFFQPIFYICLDFNLVLLDFNYVCLFSCLGSDLILNRFMLSGRMGPDLISSNDNWWIHGFYLVLPSRFLVKTSPHFQSYYWTCLLLFCYSTCYNFLSSRRCRRKSWRPRRRCWRASCRSWSRTRPPCSSTRPSSSTMCGCTFESPRRRRQRPTAPAPAPPTAVPASAATTTPPARPRRRPSKPPSPSSIGECT